VSRARPTAPCPQEAQERNQKHGSAGTRFLPKEDADRIPSNSPRRRGQQISHQFLEQSDIFDPVAGTKRLQIALQTRLEGMIRSIESVRNAGVVSAAPRATSSDSPAQPGAAVTVG
jgi:hypothetical protein